MPYSVLRGFTLIETVVAVTILITIMGTAYVGVVTFNQNQGLEDDAKLLVSEIRRVYSRATGIYYPPGCAGRLTGYTMTFTDSVNDITNSALCTPPVTEVRTDVMKTSYFEGTVSFTISASEGRVSGSPTITIRSDTNSALSKQIQVNDFGVIEILP